MGELVVLRPITPDEPALPEDRLYEVVDGRVVEAMPMGAFETHCAGLLFLAIADHLRRHRIGRVEMEMLFRLSVERKLERRPDLAFVSYERWPAGRPIPRVAAWPVVPDLAVEVVSPSNSADHVMEKLVEYFAAGVRAAWVIYPIHGIIQVYDAVDRVSIMTPGGTLDGGIVLPGFRLPLVALFGDEEVAAGG